MLNIIYQNNTLNFIKNQNNLMNHEFLLFRLQMLAVPMRYFKQNITSDRLLSSDLPVLSLIPSFSLPDVLCEPTDLIWRKGTPFEAMTGRTASSSDGLLAEVFWEFPRL